MGAMNIASIVSIESSKSYLWTEKIAKPLCPITDAYRVTQKSIKQKEIRVNLL